MDDKNHIIVVTKKDDQPNEILGYLVASKLSKVSQTPQNGAVLAVTKDRLAIYHRQITAKGDTGGGSALLGVFIQ